MGPIGPVRSCIGKTGEMKYTHISEVVEVRRVVHGALAREHRRLMIEPEKGRPTVQIEREYQRPDDQDGPGEPGAIPDRRFA